MGLNYDFSGWATKNDLECSDGRTIRKDAFKHNDGTIVPLVWNHNHDNPENVIGHALLENRDEGVYAYCSLNDSPAGQTAKQLVQHKDVNALSIFANQLKQVGGDVIHGVIREVSLVLAGANPGAFIESIIAHGDLSDEEAVIYTGEDLELQHANTVKDDSKERPKISEETPNNSENKDDSVSKTVEEIFETLNDEQKNAVNILFGKILKDEKDSKGGSEEMKQNAFENDNQNNNVLMHDALNVIWKDGKKYGSLKESYLAHAEEYGIENLDFINSEEKNYHDRPEFIRNNPTGWITTVINGVHNTPFDKVRTIFANITEDEARAKGYIKGKYKKEEVFKLLKRSVSATTIYKKQKFDRDDLIDADFDIIPWVKGEMEIMLNEEKARAYLFGDGRSSADEDKIDETHIIPVVADEDLFAIKVTVTPGQEETLEHAIITSAVVAQDDYQGSGNTTAFIEAKQVSRMLLMEDKFGHRLYKNMSELAGAMGVGKIEKVPASVIPNGIYGVILDLNDYNVGQKNLGKKTFFEDFDIDYNQQKYLLETRQSAALVRPYSAIVLKAQG